MPSCWNLEDAGHSMHASARLARELDLRIPSKLPLVYCRGRGAGTGRGKGQGALKLEPGVQGQR